MSERTLQVNGWTLYAHPLFLDQLEGMIIVVAKARAKDPEGYKKKRAAKLLAAVLKSGVRGTSPAIRLETPIVGRHARRRT